MLCARCLRNYMSVMLSASCVRRPVCLHLFCVCVGVEGRGPSISPVSPAAKSVCLMKRNLC